MTKQVRDWNKDMNMIQAYLENRHLTDYTEQRLAGEPVANVIYYWLQQYAAEKERADKLQAELSEYTEANWKAFEREKKLQEQFEVLSEFHDEALSRESKLREAIELAMKFYGMGESGRVKPLLEGVLASLYPKEEIKTFTFDAIIHVYDGIKTTVQKQRLTIEAESEEAAEKKLSKQIHDQYRPLSHLGLSGVQLTPYREEGDK